MSEGVNLIIRDNYGKYKGFVEKPKILEQCNYSLKREERYLTARSFPVCPECEPCDNMQIYINVKPENVRAYFIKFITPCFTGQTPILRFESTGAAHKNIGQEMKNKKVETPHFHKFNEKGIEYAYRTAKMGDDSFIEVLKNNCIEGLRHFHEEANVACDYDIDIMEGFFPPEALRQENSILNNMSFE